MSRYCGDRQGVGQLGVGREGFRALRRVEKIEGKVSILGVKRRLKETKREIGGWLNACLSPSAGTRSTR